MLKRLAEAMNKCPGKKHVVMKGSQFYHGDPRSYYKVPYLLYKDPTGSFESAIYINHLSPCFSSLLIERYFAFDKRVKPLCKFVLHWARVKNIINPVKGFLSSYALVLMVIFFLQIQLVPILDSIQMYADNEFTTVHTAEIPSFQNLLKRRPQWGENVRYRPENVYTDTVNLNFTKIDVESMRQKLGFPKSAETVGELLTKFFYYFGIDYPVSLYFPYNIRCWSNETIHER